MKIKTDLKSILEEHKKCVNYNVMQDYYRRTSLNEKFYIGRQWYGVNAPGFGQTGFELYTQILFISCGYDHRRRHNRL